MSALCFFLLLPACRLTPPQGHSFPDAFLIEDVSLDVPLTVVRPGVYSGGFAVQWLNMTRACWSFVDEDCVERETSAEVCIAQQTQRLLAAAAGSSGGGGAKGAAATAVPVAVVGECGWAAGGSRWQQIAWSKWHVEATIVLTMLVGNRVLVAAWDGMLQLCASSSAALPMRLLTLQPAVCASTSAALLRCAAASSTRTAAAKAAAPPQAAHAAAQVSSTS